LAYEAKGRVMLHTGRYPEAIRPFERNVALSGGNAINRGWLGYTYAKADRRRDAEQVLGELQRRARDGYVSGTALAMVYAGLGDTTQAFHWLETAAEQRDPFLLYFYVTDPILEGLRRKPRGAALLRKLNLPVTR
jgi:predicted Zn-dependent protease